MNRSTVRSFLVAAASALVAIVPMTSASAQSIVLTPEQVRSEYLAQGFQASAPTTWYTNGSTTFTVEDPTEQGSPTARVLMVIVYPDSATAEADAERHAGAHLVPGYGPSVLQGNVALMQSTRTELAQRYAAELNSNDPTHIAVSAEQLAMVAEPSNVVGLDFQAVLQTGLANL
jgi:hypothetical protein